MSWTRKQAEGRRTTLLAALREAGGNVTRAAQAVGCSRQTLYNHAVKLGLQREFGLRDEAAPEPPSPPAGPLHRAVTVKVDGELWRWARHAAIDRNWTLSAVVELALERLRSSERGEPS